MKVIQDLVTRKYVRMLMCDKGQGTAEYAVILGIVVVAAVVVLGVFRGQLQDIWASIKTGININ